MECGVEFVIAACPGAKRTGTNRSTRDSACARVQR